MQIILVKLGITYTLLDTMIDSWPHVNHTQKDGKPWFPVKEIFIDEILRKERLKHGFTLKMRYGNHTCSFTFKKIK